jgi:hypothetical protein
MMSDEPVLLGMGHLFNNRFMKAKKVFESEADTNPLFGFGLGYMAFLKGTSMQAMGLRRLGQSSSLIYLIAFRMIIAIMVMK